MFRGKRERGGFVEEHGNGPWPSSLKVNSRFSLSFSFFPLRRFLPPCAFPRANVSLSLPRDNNEVVPSLIDLAVFIPSLCSWA